MLYFVDADGKPPTRLEWDMKLWWPHAEALYALLLAYTAVSGDEKYARWFERMHDWTFRAFSRPRSTAAGTATCIATAACPPRSKGGMWKGFFHTPRALWLCWKLLSEMLA